MIDGFVCDASEFQAQAVSRQHLVYNENIDRPRNSGSYEDSIIQ